MDKDLQTKLEIYKILYMAYADEIRNLWQRSIFLATFMTLAWGGYGALQLKVVEKIIETHTQSQNAEQTLNLVYVFSSLGLCLIIIVLSLLWIAMAKASKFVQEAHEAHILKHNELDCLFCDLDKYQNGDYDTKTLKQTSKNSFWNPLKSYRYSPSKINIALGWVSCLLASILSIVHIASIFCEKWYCIGCIALVVLLIVLALFFCFKNALKGGNPTSKSQKEEVNK